MPEQNTLEQAPVTGVSTKINVDSPDSNAFQHGLSTLMLAGSKFPGFLNAEISPLQFAGVGSKGKEWIIEQRFRTPDEAKSWFESDVRKKAMDELHSSCKVVNEDMTPHVVGGAVAAAIASYVKPGMEDQYAEWLHKIQTEQSKFPGYVGTYVQPPTAGTPSLWMTLLRFDSPENMDYWLAAPIRKELLLENKKLVESENIQRMTSSFPGWMPTDPETHEAPANYKSAMLVLMAIQPIVLFQSRYISPTLKSWQPELSIFLLNATGVSLLTWVAMPFLTKVFYKWLLPGTTMDRQKTNLSGFALVLLVYIIEVIVFWNFP